MVCQCKIKSIISVGAIKVRGKDSCVVLKFRQVHEADIQGPDKAAPPPYCPVAGVDCSAETLIRVAPTATRSR